MLECNDRTLRTLFTADWTDDVVARELSEGRHAAIKAKPTSRIDQYIDKVRTSISSNSSDQRPGTEGGYTHGFDRLALCESLLE